MFQRMLSSALFAGVAAGLIAALLHFAFVQRLILLSEQYETGALTHFAGGSVTTAADVATGVVTEEAGHDHDHATETATGQGDGHSHDHGTGEAPSALYRNGMTTLFMGLVYVAYGMIMTAGFGLAQHFGFTIGPAQGLLWGLAGFASFQLAPAMGLAPELPGTIAAELGARQFWWWGCVAATATGLAIIAFDRQVWMQVVALALIAAPHLIGAPQPDGFSGLAPPELAAQYSARVLGAALVVWAALGWLAGYFWSRPEPS